jgi:hypothetical protein
MQAAAGILRKQLWSIMDKSSRHLMRLKNKVNSAVFGKGAKDPYLLCGFKLLMKV